MHGRHEFWSILEADDKDDKPIETFTTTKTKVPKTTVNELEKAEDDNESIKEKKVKEEKEVIEEQKEEKDTGLDGLDEPIGGGEKEDTTEDVPDDTDNDESTDDNESEDSVDKNDATADVEMLFKMIHHLTILEYGTPSGITPERIYGAPGYEDAADAAILDNSIRPSAGSDGKPNGSNNENEDSGGDDFGGDDDFSDDFSDDGGDEDTDFGDDEDIGGESEESTENDEMFVNWYQAPIDAHYPVNPIMMNDPTYRAGMEGFMFSIINGVLTSRFLKSAIFEGLGLVGKGLKIVASFVGKTATGIAKNFINTHARATWIAKYWNAQVAEAVKTVKEEDLDKERIEALPYDDWYKTVRLALIIDDAVGNSSHIAFDEEKQIETKTLTILQKNMQPLDIEMNFDTHRIDYRGWKEKQVNKTVLDLGYTPENIKRCSQYFEEIAKIATREKNHQVNTNKIMALSNEIAEKGNGMLRPNVDGHEEEQGGDAKKVVADLKEVNKNLYAATARLELLASMNRLESVLLSVATTNIKTVFQIYVKAANHGYDKKEEKDTHEYSTDID